MAEVCGVDGLVACFDAGTWGAVFEVGVGASSAISRSLTGFVLLNLIRVWPAIIHALLIVHRMIESISLVTLSTIEALVGVVWCRLESTVIVRVVGTCSIVYHWVGCQVLLGHFATVADVCEVADVGFGFRSSAVIPIWRLLIITLLLFIWILLRYMCTFCIAFSVIEPVAERRDLAVDRLLAAFARRIDLERWNLLAHFLALLVCLFGVDLTLLVFWLLQWSSKSARA